MSRLTSALLSASGGGPVIGQASFTSCGWTTWEAPAGVECISAVTVGAGEGTIGGSCISYQGSFGGCAGALSWGYGPVIPGRIYCIHVGCSMNFSYCGSASCCCGVSEIRDSVTGCRLIFAGRGSTYGGCWSVRCSFTGGQPKYAGNNSNNPKMGGGAAGYCCGGGTAGCSQYGYNAGNNGTGACWSNDGNHFNGCCPVGGGGGGGGRGPNTGDSRCGGGVGFCGMTDTGGWGGIYAPTCDGHPARYGTGGSGSGGPACGAGAGAVSQSASGWIRLGGRGAVRIIYPGDQRQYPTTRTADE